MRVLAHNDRALGLAYVNPQSLISARLLETWKLPDAAWFAARIRLALDAARAAVCRTLLSAGVRRIRRAAGIGDRPLRQPCVVQIGTAGMELLKPQIQQAVLQVLKCETLLFKNDGAAREMEGLPSYVETAKGKLR